MLKRPACNLKDGAFSILSKNLSMLTEPIQSTMTISESIKPSQQQTELLKRLLRESRSAAVTMAIINRLAALPANTAATSTINCL